MTSSETAPPAADWREQVIALYRGGLTVARIATHLTQSPTEVADEVTRYLDEKAASLGSAHDLVRDIDRIDLMLERLAGGINAGEVRAISQATKLSDQRRELVGQFTLVRTRTGPVEGTSIEPRPPRPKGSEVWKRRADESAKAYTAFQCFRDVGPARTMAEAWREYREMRGLKSEKVSSAFVAWSKEFDWEERTREFDNDVTDTTVGRQAAVIESVRTKYLDHADQAAEAMIAMMQGDGADHARIQACKDILDRCGIIRHRARIGGERPTALANAENMQVNFDLNGLEVDALVAIVKTLASE